MPGANSGCGAPPTAPAAGIIVDMSTTRELAPVTGNRGAPKQNPVIVTTDRDPWARMPHEGRAAFECFVTYRDGGPDRSIARVARLTGRSESTLRTWSSKWGWPARVAEWNTATASDHAARMAERQRLTLDRQFEQGERVEILLHAKVVEQIERDELYGRDVLPAYTAIRADQRKVVGHADARAGAGPAVQVNVTTVNAGDPRLMALGQAVAMWAESENLGADQLARLAAAVSGAMTTT